MNDVKVVVEKYPNEQLEGDETEVEGEVIVEVEDRDKKDKTVGRKNSAQ
jgi:hypothetical protein